ncbi:PfkB family carbohydrate kinase [Roseobacter sp. EG26]|uniref:PfkB family carbohydrate kinase n=1 Tax=Roseobacter sp. EG26 TaxID=3412477 RepID=UPI003CE58A00
MTLLVVGSLHWDVVVRAPHLPSLDETVAGSAVDYVFGGKGGNQAVSAARMGASVVFAGRAGSDTFGDKLRASLLSGGVDTSQLQRDSGPSGMSVAILDAKGDYGAVIVSAANLLIDADKIEIPTQTSLVLLQNEVPEDVNIRVAHKARAAGARVWLNAAPARPLPIELLQLTDLLVVNRVEAAFYRHLQDGPKVLTTLGPDGVCYAGNTYPGFSVEVTSSHGAGDMFMGALAAAVDGGKTIEGAIDFAQAAAACHVASRLEQRAALSRDVVSDFLRDQGRP